MKDIVNHFFTKKITHWNKQKLHEDCQEIDCCEIDSSDDFTLDETGYYVLIRNNFHTYKIELAICNEKHEIEAIFTGRTPQQVYLGLLKYEQAYNKKWLSEKSHMSYIGKELKKAELALALGNDKYFQE